jgi:hypothetical protein
MGYKISEVELRVLLVSGLMMPAGDALVGDSRFEVFMAVKIQIVSWTVCTVNWWQMQ